MGMLRLLVVASAIASAAALLQQAHLVAGGDSTNSEDLPSGVSPLDDLSFKMDALKEGIIKAKEQRVDMVNQQKMAYEEELQEQQNANIKLEASNRATASDITRLRNSNAEVHDKCIKLLNANEHITADLRKLQENVSFAQEFGTMALNVSDAALHSSSQLKVLKDMQEKDKTKKEKKNHEMALREFVNGNAMAMFQMKDKKPSKKAPSKLMGELKTSFDAVTDEQSAIMEQMQVAFNTELVAVKQRHESLLKDQAQLVVTKADEERISNELGKALTHLQTTHDHLLEKHDAAKKYMIKLSTRPIPTQAPDAAKGKPATKLMGWLR